jgi:regulator of replication initiation timing
MRNLISNVKFYTRNYWNGVVNYFTDIFSAVIGQTRKQANFLETLLDKSIDSIARLSNENRRLKEKVAQLESGDCCKTTPKKKAAKARPKKTK